MQSLFDFKVISSPMPERETVPLGSESDSNSTYFFSWYIILNSKHGEEQVLPEFRGIAFLDFKHPAASFRVLRVFPHRLDALLELSEVSALQRNSSKNTRGRWAWRAIGRRARTPGGSRNARLAWASPPSSWRSSCPPDACGTRPRRCKGGLGFP